jgi:AmmeMemoRadiSam system protein B
MRYAVVADSFYAGDERALRRQVEDCFRHPVGPGTIPELNVNGERKLKGCVSPHAGFMYSGPVAAHNFAALASDGFPETFIVIGPNHHGTGSMVAVTTQDFEMPMGVMRVDKELAAAIRRGLIDDDIMAHRYEHSIEVQLPFIQYFKPDTKFVPICMLMQDYKTAVEVGRTIGEAIDGKDVVVIASTDFSHYIPAQKAKEKDSLAIKEILDRNPKGLEEVVRKNRISMCGYGPVMAMLEAVKGSEAKLMKYATSGDVTPMPEVVGYASIIVC